MSNNKRDTRKLEEKYADFFPPNELPEDAGYGEDSLEQPSPLKYVDSTTTYGVIEAPVDEE